MSGKLILIRHQESEWNKLGKWTGRTDIGLSEKGKQDSKKIADIIANYKIDKTYTSTLARATETLDLIIEKLDLHNLPKEKLVELSERDYGDYTGKNKFEIQAEIGEAEFKRLRRGWDYKIPNGETLKQVYERVTPIYLEKVLPEVLDGKNVLIVSHGNTLRALVKFVEKISDENIAEFEFPFHQVLVYELDHSGIFKNKELLENLK